MKKSGSFQNLKLLSILENEEPSPKEQDNANHINAQPQKKILVPKSSEDMKKLDNTEEAIKKYEQRIVRIKNALAVFANPEDKKDAEEKLKTLDKALRRFKPRYGESHKGKLLDIVNWINQDHKKVVEPVMSAMNNIKDKKLYPAICHFIGGYHTANKDEKAACEWYKSSAEGEYPLGYFNLAYSYGHGSTKNLPEAIKYHQIAAKKGVPRSMFFLGQMYYEGREELIEKDLTAAFRWFIEAAYRGEQCMYQAGVCQQELGDTFEAMKCFRIAAGFGDEKAKILMNGVSNSLDYLISQQKNEKSSSKETSSGFFVKKHNRGNTISIRKTTSEPTEVRMQTWTEKENEKQNLPTSPITHPWSGDIF